MNTFILFSVLVPALALNIINLYLTTRPWTGVAIRSYCSSFLFIELQQLLIAVPAYIDDDFPENWLIPELGQVAMTVEESVHYSIWGPDAQEEWATSSPKGAGYLRLGAEHRTFALAMTHEQHCLRVIRAALAAKPSFRTTIRPAVVHFCLNYVRQMTLCSPNLTLEPVHSDDTNKCKVGRSGATHVCRDWRGVHKELANNWDGWQTEKFS